MKPPQYASQKNILAINLFVDSPRRGPFLPNSPNALYSPPTTCKFPPGGPCDPRLRITDLDLDSLTYRAFYICCVWCMICSLIYMSVCVHACVCIYCRSRPVVGMGGDPGGGRGGCAPWNLSGGIVPLEF